MAWWKKHSRGFQGFLALTSPEKWLVIEAWLEGLRAVVLLRSPWRARLFKPSGPAPGGASWRY